MPKSKVWIAEAAATSWSESLVCKAKELFYLAGLSNCIAKGDSVAVKIHVGEYNRNLCLRPELVAAIVEEVKVCGGKPFVTDTTTLPYNPTCSRITADMELQTAYRHGFTPDAMGCPVVIADGWSGCDDLRVDLPEGLILKEAYVASAIAQADAMIVVTHAKGHPIASFGGAIKNIGIGCQSKRGKFVEHLAQWGSPADGIGWPLINADLCPGTKCTFHKLCMDVCHAKAITVDEQGLHFDPSKCHLCYSCALTCTNSGYRALGFRPEYFPLAQTGMCDGAKAVLKTFGAGKVGYLSYAIDIDAMCDCVPYATIPLTPDIGVLASMDIVALDAATLDLINQGEIIPGAYHGMLEDLDVKPGDEKFKATQSTSPKYQLEAAQRLEMGTKEYELEYFEPSREPEAIFKWQIMEEPAGKAMRRIWEKHNFLQEAKPFNRKPFDINIAKDLVDEE